MQIREVFDRKRFVLLDGGMGTQLQTRGLQPGQKPELAALEMPDTLTAIHADYARAGADILLANTFGANAKKLAGCPCTVEQVVSASIACARSAAAETGALVALDIGPLGELLVPAGTLRFEDAYAEFAQVIRAGAAAGADLVFLETMTDLYELKAAILAAKENCALPVFTSMSFESRGRTFTGCTVESYAVTAAGLCADAVGINCSLGPKEILPFAQRLCRSVPAGVPVFVKPNAGLPNPDGSYNLNAAEFAAEMKAYASIGVSMVGGCCGTTPDFIAKLRETFAPLVPADKIPIRRSCLCTPVRFVEVDGITVVGERINPTGKKRLQQALRDGDSAYPCAQAVAQAEAGAQVLDVNAGLPGIDEAATLAQLVKDLQAITDLPLQLDSSNPEALSCALRIYNGKPIDHALDQAGLLIFGVSSHNGLEALEDFLDCLQKLLLLGVTLCKALIYTLQVSILNCHKKTLLYINSNTAFMLPPQKKFFKSFLFTFQNFVCSRRATVFDARTNLCFCSRFCGGRLPFYPCHIATGCQSVLPAAN